MTFNRLDKQPPQRMLIQTPAELGTMPDTQFKAEKRYWENIGQKGGILASMVAEMADDVMTHVDVCRMNRSASVKTRTEVRGRIGLEYANGVAGLALLKLMQDTILGTLENGDYGAENGLPGVDFQETHSPIILPINLIHMPVADLEKYMPPLHEEGGFTWYESETLVVRAKRPPAAASVRFQSDFKGVGREVFDASQYVSLRPQLKSAYLAIDV